MAYIVHIGIILQHSYSRYVDQEWKNGLLFDKKNIKWRLKQDRTLEIASDFFVEPQDALLYGKQLYVTLLVELLRNGILIQDAGCDLYEKQLMPEHIEGIREKRDQSFIWPKKHYGGGIGLDVYEVDSFDEIEDRAHSFSLSMQVITDSSALSLVDLNQVYFDYSPEVQEYLSILVTAETVFDIGYKMTLYCSMLERLAGKKGQKSDKTVELIDGFIECVEKSDIPKNEMDPLKNHLGNGKTKSSQQMIRELCEKYAKQSYKGIETNKIISAAYRVRSVYSHNNDNHSDDNAYLMKWVAIDTICNYFTTISTRFSG